MPRAYSAVALLPFVLTLAGMRYLGTAASGRVHRHYRAAGRERGAGTERDGGAVTAATASIGTRAAAAAGQRPGRVAAGPLGVHRGKDRSLELGVRQLCADGTRADHLDPRPMAADPHWYLGVGHRPLGLAVVPAKAGIDVLTCGV